MSNNPRICLTNIPDDVFELIMDKKTKMIKEKKKHVSNELSVFALIRENKLPLADGQGSNTNRPK